MAPDEVDRFVEGLLYLAQGAAFCVIAGSVPPGIGPEVYARLVTALRSARTPVLLDSDGEPMRAGLRAGPAVVVPNIARGRGGGRVRVRGARGPPARAAEPDRDGRGRGDHHQGGRVRGDPRRAQRPAPLRGRRSSRSGRSRRVGSGDAFLAGYVAARYDGRTPAECLAYGVACGADSTQHFGAGSLDRAARSSACVPGRGARARRSGRGRVSAALDPSAMIGEALDLAPASPQDAPFRPRHDGVFSSADRLRVD